MQSTGRSTTRLLADLDRADAASQVQILIGNTSDIVIDIDENPSRLPHLLAKRAACAGRATVVTSIGSGTRQLTPPAVRQRRFTCPTRTPHRSRPSATCSGS